MSTVGFQTFSRNSFDTVVHPIRLPMFAVSARMLSLFAAHIPIGLLMAQYSQIATMHALATLAVAQWLAVTSRRIEQVAYAVAYMAGAEVLWRMTHAQVFWEYGKYATISVLLVAVVRTGRIRNFTLPLLYFAVLLPSILFTVMRDDFGAARQLISFNLSGPFALMVSVWFFSNIRLTLIQLHSVFIALLSPVVAISTVVVQSILSSSSLNFGPHSNHLTSGNFGPNQVSAILGLASLVAFYCMVNRRTKTWSRLIFFATFILFGVQSALTFSRTGVFLMIGGVATFSVFHLIKGRRSKVQLTISLILIIAICASILLPRLEVFTGGTLLPRFESLNSTGRDLIARADLIAWRDNFLFGVGPGKAMRYYTPYIREDTSAHTEFTRLLSEHGLLGLVSLLLLFLLAGRSLIGSRDFEKATVASLIVWCFLFMSTNAMRLVAPSFLFGLTFAKLWIETRPPRQIVPLVMPK
jgi:O-antigen ligase